MKSTSYQFPRSETSVIFNFTCDPIKILIQLFLLIATSQPLSSTRPFCPNLPSCLSGPCLCPFLAQLVCGCQILLLSSRHLLPPLPHMTVSLCPFQWLEKNTDFYMVALACVLAANIIITLGASAVSGRIYCQCLCGCIGCALCFICVPL